MYSIYKPRQSKIDGVFEFLTYRLYISGISIIKSYIIKRRGFTSKDIFALLKKGSMSALTASVVNFILAGLKGVAFLFTANVAMFAEMMHSLGDAINQLFVFTGSSLAKKAPTKRFPFGFGRLVNLVCLFAIIIVAILSYETIREGIHHIIKPLPTQTDTTLLLVNIGVLAISMMLEGSV